VTLTAVPTTGPEGVNVDFTCDITGGDQPFSVLLDFGDGTTTTDTSASHDYMLEGVYTASCMVTDADGDIGMDEVDINVTNNAPVVDIDVNVTSGLEPLTVEYNCSVGGGNAPFGYTIDFGDGSAFASDPTGTHYYSDPGIYTMTCTVVDDDGDVDFDQIDIEVIDNPPIVDLIAVPTTGPEGVTVDFTCDVTNGNAPFGILILFGDGGSSVGSTASHTYPLEGVYNATCNVLDADGDSGTDSELINITNNPPVVNLITNVTDGAEPLSVDFNCTVGNGNEPFTYSIDFGDGSPAVPSATAAHTYAQNGTYDATCTVVDTDGDMDIDIATITVYDTEPDTLFNFTPVNPIEGDFIQFTDLSTAYDGIVAWDWDLGDGNTSTAQNPGHTYYLEGSYIVVLTTTDGDGSQTSHVETVNVGNNVPVVQTTVTPSSGTEPLFVVIDCAILSGGNGPFAYEILFGDGTSAVAMSASHTYNQDGTYPVTCMVTDNDGDVGVDVDVDVGVGCTAVHPVALVSSLSPSAIEIKASVVIPVSTLPTALK